MRIIITVAAVVSLGIVAQGLSFAQSGSQRGQHSRCAQLASQQGLSAKSASGRKFIARCMERRQTYESSRNCPDDPKARSAYPAWMCR
jgi:hypothetical protein